MSIFFLVAFLLIIFIIYLTIRNIIIPNNFKQIKKTTMSNLLKNAETGDILICSLYKFPIILYLF